MVMGDVKMAEELLAEAPLASAEEDFTDFNSNKLLPAPPQHNANDSGGRPTGLTDGRTVPTKPSNRTTTVVITKTAAGGGVGGGADGTDGRSVPPPPTDNEGLLCDDVCLGLDFGEPNLGAFSASLEDLVSSFDEKITKCLRDYDQTTDQLAPVQVRSQEEIMKSDQTPRTSRYRIRMFPA